MAEKVLGRMLLASAHIDYASQDDSDQGLSSCLPLADLAASLVIDRMRQGSILVVGSVGPLHGPGRQRSHASAGQPDRPEGEDQLGPTTSHLGQCRRRTSRDPADEPDVLY